MPFSDLPEHLLMPALRQFQAWPVQKEGNKFIALRDPFMLTKEVIAIPPNVFAVIQLIDGDTTLEDLGEKTKAKKMTVYAEKLKKMIKSNFVDINFTCL